MSRSGVGLAQNCVPTFEELKLGKRLKYVIYKVSDDKKSIEVEKQSSDADYSSFVDTLPSNECRFAVYDFEYELSAAEGKRRKICFIAWSPDDAPVRGKMIYASSKEALRRALTGVAAEIQATDEGEIAYESVLERVRGKDK